MQKREFVGGPGEKRWGASCFSIERGREKMEGERVLSLRLLEGSPHAWPRGGRGREREEDHLIGVGPNENCRKSWKRAWHCIAPKVGQCGGNSRRGL